MPSHHGGELVNLHGAETASTHTDGNVGSWAVLQLWGGLTECKGLSSAKLGTLLELVHALFTGELVVLMLHLDVVLRKAHASILFEELAVTTLEDVHLWVGESWVVHRVYLSVVLADKLGHAWSTVNRVLAVKDQKSLWWRILIEKILGQAFLVIIVDSLLDVSSVILILEATVDNHDLIVVCIVLSVDDIDEGVLLDTWQTVWLVRTKVW